MHVSKMDDHPQAFSLTVWVTYCTHHTQHGYLVAAYTDATGLLQWSRHKGQHLIISRIYSTVNVYLLSQFLLKENANATKQIQPFSKTTTWFLGDLGLNLFPKNLWHGSPSNNRQHIFCSTISDCNTKTNLVISRLNLKKYSKYWCGLVGNAGKITDLSPNDPF